MSLTEDQQQQLSDLSERQKSKYKVWRPTERQTSALQIPYSVSEILYGGALGGGKTDYALAFPIVKRTLDDKCQLYQHPRFRGIIMRRTYPQLNKHILSKALYWYCDILGARHNSTDKAFYFPSGAIVYYSHAEHEKDVKQHDTNEYNFICLEQAEQFTEFQIRYMMSRIRSPYFELPKVMLLTANPGGESHNYLKERFVRPCPAGNVILVDKLTKTKRIFIPAKLQDNPHIYEDDPDYINRLQLLPESEKKAKIDGDWFSFSGAVFTEFRSVRHLGEPENALHVIPPIEIPSWWIRLIAIDWGYDANTVVLWLAIAPNNRIYIYREYVCKGKHISDWASDVARISQYEKISKVIIDPSAWQTRGDQNIAQQFSKFSGFSPEKGINDRIGGKHLLHEYLRWEIKPPKFIPAGGFDIDTANQILRARGLEAYKDYMQTFVPEEPEINLPKLQIFQSCPNLIECIQNCQYDDDATSKEKREDVKEFSGDDPYDCIRYGIFGVKEYLNSLGGALSYYTKYDEVMSEFSKTNDYTKLDFQLLQLEKLKGEIDPRPVSLIH